MRRIAYLLGSIGLLASLAAAQPAAAQCRLCAAGTSTSAEQEPKVPIQLEVESSLSFDRLVMMGTGDGTAILKPDGTRLVSGSLGDFNGSAMVGSAVVRGEPHRLVRIDFPRIIELHSLTGAQLMIDEISTNLPSSPRLDSNGRLTFRFGGRLRVNGEADGDYRGDLLITADYL